MSLEDTSPGSQHSSILSLAQDSRKVSSLDLTVNLNHKPAAAGKGGASMSPLGSVTTSLAQMRVIVSTPFMLQIMVSHTYSSDL